MSQVKFDKISPIERTSTHKTEVTHENRDHTLEVFTLKLCKSGNLIYKFTTCVRPCVRPTRQFRVLIRRQNSPAEPAGPAFSMAEPVAVHLCVRLSVTTGRREK
jgi:hypothetical protein